MERGGDKHTSKWKDGTMKDIANVAATLLKLAMTGD